MYRGNLRLRDPPSGHPALGSPTRHVDPGFRIDHTLFFSLDPGIERYDEAKTRDFYKELTERLRESGRVTAVSISSSIPFSTGQMRRKYLAEARSRGHHQGR